MPPIVVPNAAEMAIRWSAEGKTVHNVLGLALSPGFVLDSAAAADIAGAVETVWASADLRNSIANTTVLDSVKVTDLRTDPHPVFETAVGGAGGNTNRSVPRQVALCVSLTTEHPGRSGRGRVYLAGVNVAQDEALSNQPTDVVIENAVDFIDLIREQLLVAFPEGDVQLAVISRTNLERYLVTGALVKTRTWCTQRRRAR